jgi:hypothetical protein
MKQDQRLFVKVFFQEWLKTQPQFTSLETTIISYLMERMDIGNEVKFGPKQMQEVADMIQTSKKSIQTTFYRLLKRQPTVVIRTDEYEYMICPEYAIKHKDFDSIELLYKAHEDKDGNAVMEQRLIIRNKGKEVDSTSKVNVYPVYKPDLSKFI